VRRSGLAAAASQTAGALTVRAEWYRFASGNRMQSVPFALEDLEGICRAKGLSLTVQRRALIEELCRRTDHPTADDLFQALSPRLPGLSRTTVYRVLETLVGVGALRRVVHAGATARFDPRLERHHHLVCERCGALADLPDAAVPKVPLRGVATPGFRILDYSIQFNGTCAACRGDARTISKEKRRPWPRTSRTRRPTRT
jgi:Fur family peroxide stress response transcriptional regulator